MFVHSYNFKGVKRLVSNRYMTIILLYRDMVLIIGIRYLNTDNIAKYHVIFR